MHNLERETTISEDRQRIVGITINLKPSVRKLLQKQNKELYATYRNNKIEIRTRDKEYDKKGNRVKLAIITPDIAGRYRYEGEIPVTY